MVWSVQFEGHRSSRYDYSEYSLPDPLEPNECMITCATLCESPALRTMATGCVKLQVGCVCSSGQTGTCTGCRYECSSQPGWMPYSADQLAEKSCAESIEHCMPTCNCSGRLHRLATVALSMHFWVSAWTIFPITCFLMIVLPFSCLCFVCLPRWCKCRSTNIDREVIYKDDINDIGCLQQRHTIANVCNMDKVSVCWIIVTAIANVSDMVLGWVVMNNIEHSSDSHSIGQICGHEYIDATRLGSSNLVATFRACPCVLALLYIVLASSNCALQQPPLSAKVDSSQQNCN